MKKTNLILLLLLSGIIVFTVFGCSKSDSGSTTPPTTTDCTGVSPSFASDVLPLITTKCATNSGCHAAGSTNSGGVLTSYAQISARKSNIKSQVSSGAMPQNSTLTASQKAIIVCWVSNGGLNN